MITRSTLWVWSILVTALLSLTSCSASEPRGPVVFAASSLQRPLEKLAAQWAEQGHDAPVLSFASSTALARQVDNGSPADLFISADAQWIEYVVSVGKLDEDAIRPLASNSIALATHVDNPLNFDGDAGASSDSTVRFGSIATGDPATVPLGKYAQEALDSIGLWEGFETSLIRTPSSSSALRLVLLQEVEIGILYVSDIVSREDLKFLLAFPPAAHSPIIYKALKLPSSAHPDTQDFLDFLSSESARAVFDEYGFSRP